MRAISLLLLAAGFAQGSTILIDPDFEIGGSRDGDWTRELFVGARPWFRSSLSPQSGSWSAGMVSYTEGAIGQTFSPILGGAIIEFSFWGYRRDSADILIDLFYGDGTSSGTSSISASLGESWTFFDATTLVDDTRALTGFTITKLGEGTAGLDNFSLAVVPEPETAILFALSGLLVATNRSRTRRDTATPMSRPV